MKTVERSAPRTTGFWLLEEAGRACRLDTKRKILLALGLRVTDKHQVFEAAVEEPRVMPPFAPPGEREFP
jgi:hypothetical protein